MTTPRSNVRVLEPLQAGNGTMYMWSRLISGRVLHYCLVIMPNGEIRVRISQYQGKESDRNKFSCDFRTVRYYTLTKGYAS